MALAIDASSPAVATQATVGVATVTTASFTPPSGSLLVIGWAGNNNSGNTPTTPTITDSLGAHLTYSQADWASHVDNASLDAQTAFWTAPVASSAAMTVTVTNHGVTAVEAALKIWVLTGENATPVGAHGKNFAVTATGSISQGYTAQATSGWGFMAVCDWSATGNETAGTGNTVDGTGSVGAGQISYAFDRRTTADDSNGSTNTLATTLTANSTNLSWVYIEILPVAAAATFPPQRQRRPRPVPLRVARSRQTVPVRAQVNPPIPVQEIRPSRQLRGYLIRRGKLAQTVPPQFNPPYPFAEVVQPRRLRGLLPRRGRQAIPIPPQFNPPFPWAEIVQPRRLRGALLRRGRLAAAPPQLDQIFPVQEIAQPRRPRGWLLRRGKLAQTVPPQFNPPFPFAEVAQPRRLRGLLPRRGKLAQVVQTQAAAAPPAYPPQTLRARVKAYRPFRAHQAQVVPAQQAAPVNPAFVPSPLRERVRLAFLRRSKTAQPVPAQDGPLQLRTVRRACPVHGRPRMAIPIVPAQGAPVPGKAARRPLLATLRRGARALLPLKQATPPANPAFVPTPAHHRLQFLPRIRRRGAPFPLVCDCTTHRPGTGTTLRPSTGTTAYDTATTARPSTGTTTRPNTGITKDPCC